MKWLLATAALLVGFSMPAMAGDADPSVLQTGIVAILVTVVLAFIGAVLEGGGNDGSGDK